MSSPEQVLAAGAHFGFAGQVDPHLTDLRPTDTRPDQYRTFQIAAPRASHYRAASCEEYGCLDWRHGWEVHLQALTPDQRAAVEQHGGRYRHRVEDRGPGRTVWVFEAGQSCFRVADHAVPVGRPALFVVRRGDHRWSEVTRVHQRPEDWRDDAAEHLDRIGAAHAPALAEARQEVDAEAAKLGLSTRKPKPY